MCTGLLSINFSEERNRLEMLAMIYLLIGALFSIFLFYPARDTFNRNVLGLGIVLLMLSALALACAIWLLDGLRQLSVIKDNEFFLTVLGLSLGALLTFTLPFTVTPMARSGRLSR